jgi:outer membrane lipoprotein-sorting protein
MNVTFPLVSAMGATLFIGSLGSLVHAQKPVANATPALNLSRASLAQTASFTVTQSLKPNGGSPLNRVFKIEVKGNKARLDYEDPAVGPVHYLANEKGAYFVMPENKTAMKQSFQGGVETALRVAFAQAREQLVGAKKIGTETVSGQPTVVYQAKTGGTRIYMGTRPGFKLPVKIETRNEGGTSTLLVTNIRLNQAIADNRFTLPPGTKVQEGDVGVPTLGGF